MVEIPSFSYSSPARDKNGVIGSLSGLTTCCIRASRSIKLVAEVSSSSKNTWLPASIASTIPAACEVLPLASSVEKRWVSFLFGRSLINMEMSASLMKRPSSARSFTAVSSVMTYSLPSPAIWLYTPSSNACKSVDFPWYPPPTINVIPSGIPIPVMVPLCGSSMDTRRLSGDENATESLIGLEEIPLSRGRIDPSATNATRCFSFNWLRIASWSSASAITLCKRSSLKFLK